MDYEAKHSERYGRTSRTKDSPASRRSRSVPLSDKSADPNLERYFGELSRHGLLSREQEQELTRHLAKLDLERWKLLLSVPPVQRQALGWIGNTDQPQRVHHTPADQAAQLVDEDSEGQWMAKAQQQLEHLSAKTLDASDLRDLVRRAKDLERRTCRIKQELVRSNLRLVISLARRYPRDQLSLADLIQEGNLGLLKAVDRFDHRRGLRFSTFASWWIRSAITHALATKTAAVKISANVAKDRRLLERITTAFAARWGRSPTDEELAAATGFDPRRMSAAQSCEPVPQPILPRGALDPESSNDMDLLADDNARSPIDTIALSEWSERIDGALEVLTPREQDIIQRRFGLNRAEGETTLSAIGRTYSLTRERIRQIQNKALAKMRLRLNQDTI